MSKLVGQWSLVAYLSLELTIHLITWHSEELHKWSGNYLAKGPLSRGNILCGRGQSLADLVMVDRLDWIIENTEIGFLGIPLFGRNLKSRHNNQQIQTRIIKYLCGYGYPK